MRKIDLILFGKIKGIGVPEQVNYYSKLLSRYFNLNIVHRKDPGERKLMLADISPNGYIIALSEKGQSITSLEFSKKLQQITDNHSQITIVLGNAFGLDADLLARADMVWSLSALTLPHEMALVVALEQLFRACDIAKGGKYHK